MGEVNFQAKISSSLYRKIYFYLFFRQRWWIFLILYSCLFSLCAKGWKEARAEGEFPVVFYTLILVTILFPLVALMQANRRYTNNKRLQGVLHFRFSSESLTVKGDTFESINATSNFSRVIETRFAFLLVLDTLQTQIMPKEGITDEQVRTVRSIFAGLPLKQKLLS